MSGSHSILAPSDAVRWARCPGAVHLSRGLPDVDAEYNASGTCSHWILEQSLKNGTDPLVWLGKEMEFGGFKFTIDEDRCERVQQTIDAIKREPGQMWVEKLVNTSPILGVPDQIGHADIVKLDTVGSVEVRGELYQGVLSVHDFKDGYLIVNAKNNLQGLMYCAALMYEFDLVAPVNVVRFCIHQPKMHHYDEWAYTREEINAFIQVIRPIAKQAYDIYHGNIEFDAAIHLNAGEEQCFWCPVRGSCPARAKRIVEMFSAMITKHAIDDETLGKIFVQLDEISQAVSDYRTEALRRALQGRTIPGQKLVKGRRGRRYWKDKTAAEVELKKRLPLAKVYEPPTLISPTVAENELKRVDKDAYQTALKPYVGQEDGGLSLAPLDDGRPEVKIEQFKPVLESPNEDLR